MRGFITAITSHPMKKATVLPLVLFLLCKVITTHASNSTTFAYSQVDCAEVKGQGENGVPAYSMEGNTDTGVTLTISGATNGVQNVPNVNSGEHWRSNDLCYKAVTTLKLDGVTEVTFGTFRDLKRLKTVQSDSLSTIGDYAFASTGVTTLNIPNVIKIGKGAFEYCTDLTDVSIVFGRKLDNVGDYAFQGTSITKVEVADGEGSTLTGFEIGVFKDCVKLVSFSYASTSNIHMTVTSSLFEGCQQLSEMGQFVILDIEARGFFGCLHH